MTITDINQILSEKGKQCISIVVPTHRYKRERMLDPKVIHKTVHKAKEMLYETTWPTDKIQQLDEKLDAVLDTIDYVRLHEGLAIFISPRITRIFLLPFEVKKKVVLGNSFDMRDVFYYAQFLKTYYLLTISKNRIRLFKGEGHDMQEVINDDFPKQYTEEYEYARPSIGSSSSAGLKAYERDKSIVQETRQMSFLRQVDNTMDKYLKGDTPLLIAGTEEALSNFEQVTHHASQVAGKISGNYDYDALHLLSEAAWQKMGEFIQTTQKKTLEKLQEDIGRDMATDGFTNVWRAAKEGRGLTLLCEKDYNRVAYRDLTDNAKIFLTAPPDNYETLPNAVNELMETVIEKGGNIVIVENGVLKNHGHVALLLRYPL